MADDHPIRRLKCWGAQDVLRGKPRVSGTRIPASLVLGYLAEFEIDVA